MLPMIADSRDNLCFWFAIGNRLSKEYYFSPKIKVAEPKPIGITLESIL